MKSEKFLVTSFVKNQSRTQLWDSSEPLAIDPEFKWILERSETTPQIRRISGSTTPIDSNPILPISDLDIDSEKILKLPDQFAIQLKRIKPIPPAYLSNSSENSLNSLTQDKNYIRLWVFSGTGRALMNGEQAHTSYVGYSRQTPVFTLQASSDGYIIRPLLPNTQLKLRKKESIAGTAGDSWKLTMEELAGCTIVRGSHWWRFNWVDHQKAKLKNVFIPTWAGDEGNLFRNVIIGISVISLGLSSLILVLPRTEKIIQKEAEPPTVKFVVPRHKKLEISEPFKLEPIAAREKQPSKGPSAAKAAPAPAPKAAPAPAPKAAPAPAPKAAPAPAPKAAPVPAPKAAPVPAPKAAPAPVPKAPAKAAPTPNTGKKVQSGIPVPSAQKTNPKVSAASRLAALRYALGGALSLTQKTPVAVTNTAPSSSNEIFKSTGSSLSPTEIKPGYTSSSKSDVKGIGGGSNGSSYGSSYGGAQSVGRVTSGGGGSFVATEPEGIEVEKGLLQSEVGALIHSHMKEIRYCHESALLSRPNLTGKIIVNFSIDPTGRVEKLKIESSTVGDQGLEGCIQERLVKWQFPKPKGGIHVAVSYPFIFKTLERE